MKKIIFIPARLSSKRLPNKVLLDLEGKTILQRVYEQCDQVKDAEVFVATDSQKVEESCLKFTRNVIMTSSHHKSGTERIIEAVKKLDYDLLINVQGDEPFINPLLIESLFNLLEHKKDDVVTVCEKYHRLRIYFDPNIV
jgi:CMP-2-keto-3-deoxyoctulosonic acid synthetase